jgi:hypothetical protein
MKPIGITLAIVLFSAGISPAVRCYGEASDQPSDASTAESASTVASNASVPTDAAGKPIGFKPIAQLTPNIAPSKGELPQNYPLAAAPYQPRAFAPCTFTWVASGLCHKPLYFEDVQLERYGHTGCPCLQPILSGVSFFTRVVVLPYEMGVELPREDIYVLGYDRPGSCSPYMIEPIPLSLRGAMFEGGASVGGVFAFP